MTLEEVLQRYDCRLSLGDKWMVRSSFGEWFVYQRQRYAKVTRALIATDNLSIALETLTKDEEPQL